MPSELIAIREHEIDIRTPAGLLTIRNDFVLAMTGYRPDFNILKNLGVDLKEGNCPVYNPNTMETSLKGQ